MQPLSGAAARGQWLALTAALLGWLFDGFEMGLFPVVARPALKELIELGGGVVSDQAVSFWFSLATAGFLVGAATGGVVFGWLGDRLGRVRAMTLSILTYALCSGLGGFAAAPWQMVVIRFIAALGMGGEWSLGVALLAVWQQVEGLAPRIASTVLALVLVAGCFLFPIIRYLNRAGEPAEVRNDILRRMVLAAVISSVPLLATWGAVQWAPAWAH